MSYGKRFQTIAPLAGKNLLPSSVWLGKMCIFSAALELPYPVSLFFTNYTTPSLKGFSCWNNYLSLYLPSTYTVCTLIRLHAYWFEGVLDNSEGLTILIYPQVVNFTCVNDTEPQVL